MSEAPGHEMPFLDHLEELRHRLFWIAAAVVVGVVVAFILLSKLDIIRLLERPILPLLHGQKLIYTHPGTSFHILLNASLVLGIILASPVVVGQLWGFLAPALYAHEKKVIVPVLVAIVVLFLLGIALSYFVVLPLTLTFLMSIESTALTPMISATDYFDFAISMCLAFGAVFEVPIAILALTALGLVSPKFLSRYRRHAIVICLTAAAFITPGADPYSLFALAIPLYLLYELSVAVAFFVVRQRDKRQRRRDEEERREQEAERAAELRAAETMPAPGLRRLMMLLVAASLAVAPHALSAQVPGARPTQTLRPDTTRRDTTKRDSTQRDLIKWTETDSVMQALLRREGYTATRYQGAQAVFNAQTRTLTLKGKPAGVNREQTILVGDSIIYSDSTKIIVARGDTVILRDPQQQAADVIARGQMAYNIELHRGVVTNITTQIAQTGENWFVSGRAAAFVSDTSRGKETAFYVRNGTITSCDDSIPDYHFRANEIKMVSKNIMVARPAVLYIGDVPIMWLPFIFQDMRSGRRSGVLTPRFGLSELFRNSPTYRRHLENLGYYFAISDYMDAQFALDWRSGSRPSEGDPGWIQYNGEMQYRWLDRFITGRLAASYHAQRDGTSNTSVSWNHNQDFSQDTRFHADVNYVTNTTLQRTTTFNVNQVLASIRSTASYDTKIGPAALGLGFSNAQHSGRKEVDREFPKVSLSSPAIAVTSWLDWTPSFSFDRNQQLNMDQGSEFPYRYFTNSRGVQDSVANRHDERRTTSSFSTPIRIGGFNWQNSFSMNESEIDAPQTWVIRDPADSSVRISRVFAKSFDTNIDWQTSFNLPSFNNALHLTPSLGFTNVDGSHGFWVRSIFSNGTYVHQSKRPTFSLSASPTLFALFPGFGPVSRFRHSITPTIQYSYAPTGHLSDEFLQATNRTRQQFLGSLAQNQITVGLTHVLEAKVKNDDTSSVAEPKKIKVLSMDFSSVAYDFERARKTHRSGFSTSDFNTSVTSDLVPGFNGHVGWSLYQGELLSDTARFKPYLTNISSNVTLNAQSGIFGIFTRLFGRAVPPTHPQIETTEPTAQDALANRVASTPIAGITSRQQQFSLPADQGWSLSLSYSLNRQRPPTGHGVIIDQNAFQAQCAPLQVNPIVYEQCLQQALTQAQNQTASQGTTLGGGTFFRTPTTQNVNSAFNFHLTPNWAGSWNTNYDFESKKFGAHSVTLQRQLHDWRAIFGFTQAPNGNFAFNFFIALNAEPDLKFNYDRATYRPITR